MSATNGFDFTARMRDLCQDMVTRVSDLHHIDVARVLLCFSQARNKSLYGTYATLTPMRFKDGSLTTRRRSRTYTVQRVFDPDGEEMLYILSFYLPRFMETDYKEKLVTIFHELWHISPKFDGDIRRHPGRCYAHTGSQREYDQQMGMLADKWLDLDPPAALHDFLHCNFTELKNRFGRIYGTKIRQPKLIPVAEDASQRTA